MAVTLKRILYGIKGKPTDGTATTILPEDFYIIADERESSNNGNPLEALLTDLSLANSNKVTASDQLLVAIGKLQAQLNKKPSVYVAGKAMAPINMTASGAISSIEFPANTFPNNCEIEFQFRFARISGSGTISILLYYAETGPLVKVFQFFAGSAVMGGQVKKSFSIRGGKLKIMDPNSFQAATNEGTSNGANANAETETSITLANPVTFAPSISMTTGDNIRITDQMWVVKS